MKRNTSEALLLLIIIIVISIIYFSSLKIFVGVPSTIVCLVDV